MESWQAVPPTFEEVCEWVFIWFDKDEAEWSRAFSVMYKNPGEFCLPGVYPVTLRLQGVLKDYNLSALGVWDG